jgi:hypothetical protein
MSDQNGVAYKQTNNRQPEDRCEKKRKNKDEKKEKVYTEYVLKQQQQQQQQPFKIQKSIFKL